MTRAVSAKRGHYGAVMARPLRIEEAGIHHVVTRGNNKRRIYEDDRDRTLFCLRLTETARKEGWSVLAYVLMRNHYHLLLRIGDRGLRHGMQQLNYGHALTYNARHGRINHLFGKRYWSRYLVTDPAVQNAARYIVQNPRRAGGRQSLETYGWSSYAATIGVTFAAVPLAVDELLPFFGGTPSDARMTYRDFCAQEPQSAETELEGTRPVPGTARPARVT